jgi:TldD protein
VLFPLFLITALAQADPILEALTGELERTTAAWEGEEDAPYYLSYRVSDLHSWNVSARHGALSASTESHQRVLDVSARVGSYELDSQHPLRGGGFNETNYHAGASLPVDASAEAMRVAIWGATHKEVSDAREAWAQVKTRQIVRVEEEDASADFSPAQPVEDLRPPAELSVNRAAWEEALRQVSAALNDHPLVYGSEAELSAVADTRYVVTSEGTQIRQPRTWLRVSISAWTRAEDGMELQLYRWKDVSDPARLPAPEELLGWADGLVADLTALREAPVGEPYSGPLLLRGRAAGVFVHEVMGHRLEGHRQKREGEGHTFKDKVGEPVLPEGFQVYDDPTLAQYAGEDLNGFYAYDEEGVPAQRAQLVEDGVLTGFLMGRSPIEGSPASNGHGRAALGRLPVARMANTVLESDAPLSEEALRAELRQELVAQGREWGLMVDEIGGGFTMTGRVRPNAFNVRATYAWRIYADGRPDELVRGVDLVGTPLVALSSVVAAGDDPAVFNGFCGAESGMVPNSATAPSLLLRQLEVQKKEKGNDRTPILPKPPPGSPS